MEDAIAKTLSRESRIQNVSIEDLDFYLSSKKGKVKDDFPAIDKTQKISKVNFERFVIVHKNQSQTNWEE